MKSKLLHANFVSVLCDRSTDSSVTEKEVIYVIYVDPETFVPTCSSFALKEPISQDASGIKQAIQDCFRKRGLSDKVKKLKCASLVLRSALFIDFDDSAWKFTVISQKAEVNICY